MVTSDAEKTERFGYNPSAKLQLIGTTIKSYPYLHGDGNAYSGRFEFYYSPLTGNIDVCHLGCNGTIFSGQEAKDGTITFQTPYGYPNSDLFAAEFNVLRDSFLTKEH